jgi:hypothetical protein
MIIFLMETSLFGVSIESPYRIPPQPRAGKGLLLLLGTNVPGASRTQEVATAKEAVMTNHNVGAIDNRRIARRLEALAWGLFFIWVGITLLVNIGWGIALLGIGVLILGGQVARKYLSLRFEAFWILAGIFFIMSGVWMLIDIRISLIPVFSIVAGVALLVSAFVGKLRDSEETHRVI